MMAIRSTAVRLEYLGHDSGHWCNTCKLGTGYRIWVVLHLVGRAHVQTRRRCSQCAGTDVTFDPDIPICPTIC